MCVTWNAAHIKWVSGPGGDGGGRSHSVTALSVHIQLDYVVPLDNWENKTGLNPTITTMNKLRDSGHFGTEVLHKLG